MSKQIKTVTGIKQRKEVEMDLLNQVLHPTNLTKALQKVVSNKGKPGVDGMKVSELEDFMHHNRDTIIETIINGTYDPKPVKGVEIDKLSGGKRLLGIPTVVDRMIQQAINQVLSPLYDVEFSAFSYGFRPNRGAHQAISQALTYIYSGYQDITDLDLIPK